MNQNQWNKIPVLRSQDGDNYASFTSWKAPQNKCEEKKKRNECRHHPRGNKEASVTQATTRVQGQPMALIIN